MANFNYWTSAANCAKNCKTDCFQYNVVYDENNSPESASDLFTHRVNQGILDNLVKGVKMRYNILHNISNEELIIECQKRGLLNKTPKLPSLGLHPKYKFLI